jgi:hypothetical protein
MSTVHVEDTLPAPRWFAILTYVGWAYRPVSLGWLRAWLRSLPVPLPWDEMVRKVTHKFELDGQTSIRLTIVLSLSLSTLRYCAGSCYSSPVSSC